MRSEASMKLRVFSIKTVQAVSTAVVILLMALVQPTLAQEAMPTEGYVFTADEGSQTITRIDVESGEKLSAELPIVPHNVQLTGDGKALLVVGAAGGHGADGHGDGAGRLIVLDPVNLDAGPSKIISVGESPAHVVSDAEGKMAYVSNSADDTVSAVDLTMGEVVGTIPAGDYPHGLRLSNDGTTLMVANLEDGTVSLIDPVTLTEIDRITVGETPVQVGFLPDDSRAYVSLRDSNQVAAIDLARREVVERIDVGRSPIQLYVTPDGRFVYVANQGIEEKPDNRVSVIEVASRSIVATLDVGDGAHGVVVTPDGRRVYVSNTFNDSVSVIDVESHSVISSFSTGQHPTGITYLAL